MPFSHRWSRLLLALAAVLLLLRFVHLSADYPRDIRWDDAAATDEGWYASGAINAGTWGHAYLQGDFNPQILLPVWPLALRGVFAVTGVGLAPMRATAVVCSIASLLLMLWVLRCLRAEEWIPVYAILFALNPWGFAFARTGMLETPMLLFFLLALVAALTRITGRTQEIGIAALTGFCFTLAMLTKTSAVALVPVLLLAMLMQREWNVRRTLIPALVCCSTIAILFGSYWLVMAGKHPAEFAYFAKQNGQSLHFVSVKQTVADVSRPFRYGLGSDHVMFLVSLVALAAATCARKFRGLWRQPVFALAGAWFAGVMLFIVAHNNAPVRYFVVLVPALPLMAVALLQQGKHLWRTVLALLVTANAAVGAAQISVALLTPRYTLRDDSLAMSRIVSAHAGNAVVLGDNSHQLALVAHWKPVNLLFHVDGIDDQLARYTPGWYVEFSPQDSECRVRVLAKRFDLVPRGEWTLYHPGSRVALYALHEREGASAILTKEQQQVCEPPTPESAALPSGPR